MVIKEIHMVVEKMPCKCRAETTEAGIWTWQISSDYKFVFTCKKCGISFKESFGDSRTKDDWTWKFKNLEEENQKDLPSLYKTEK